MEDDIKFPVNLPNLSGYIPVKEAAEMLGIAPKTLYQHIARGRIAAVKAGSITLIPVEEIENFEPNIAGRPRTSIPLWRISPTDNALLYTAIDVQIRPGKLNRFKQKINEIRREKAYLFPGTIARYILGSKQAPERLEIVLIWRISVMPDEATRQQELEAFKQALADVLDWSTARYDDGTVLMHT